MLMNFGHLSSPGQVLNRCWTVLDLFKDCSGPEPGMFWTGTRNVLSMVEECSEPERGWSEAGLGMI